MLKKTKLLGERSSPLLQRCTINKETVALKNESHDFPE